MSSPSTKQIYNHFDHRILEESGTEDDFGKNDAAEVVDYTNLKYSAVTPNYNALPTYPPRPHFNLHHIHMKPASQVVAFDGCPNDPYHPASMPIYQTATFVQPSATEFGPYDYTRSGNPTRTALETLVAGLENAYSAFAFVSGMAALSTVTRLVKAGEEIVAGDDLYGGMYRLLTKVSLRCGIGVKFVDTTDLEKLKQALTPSTKLLHIESPSNPLMRISDIRAIADILHKRGILFSIDSTMMTPILQRPLDLGADIVVHSGTKFFGGHSDTTLGVVCVKTEELAKEIAFFQNAEGTGLDPFSCWLVLRGVKTMALRVERSQENAVKVATYLAAHPLVTDLHYAGLKPTQNPPSWFCRDREYRTLLQEFEIHNGQAKGGSCVLSFTTASQEISRRFVNSLRLFKITVSFGSTNSLVELPCLLSHASIPSDKRTLPASLVRLSIGIEHIDDILHDIDQAFKVVQLKLQKKN